MHVKAGSPSARQDPCPRTGIFGVMSLGTHGVGAERMPFLAGHESLHKVRQWYS